MLLEGKKAIVTGGSRGIGAAVVLHFLNEGASVSYIARTPGDSQAAFEEAASRTGTHVTFERCDISDREQLSALVERMVKDVGDIEILVNNAGITRDGLVFRMSTTDWDDVLNTNLTSAFITCKTVAYQMLRRRSGSIINVSSISGLRGNAGQTNYSASKAGLVGFSKSLARELASRSVRVNVVAPGYIDTAMTDRLEDRQKELLLGQIPMARVGTADEVADTVVFLASDLSTYITGQVIQIDGGLGM